MSYGLPKPPEGYFWRIKSLPLSTLPVVQLRKKGWLFSNVVDEFVVWNDDKLEWERATELVAFGILRRLEERAKREAFLTKAYGSYPPKTTKDWQ